MTDFASLLVADRGQQARPIHLVDKDSFAGWLKKRPAEDRALLDAHRFDGKTGFAFALLPRGNEFEVVSAVKHAAERQPNEARARERLHALLREKLAADELERLLAEGANMSEDDACRLALED